MIRVSLTSIRSVRVSGIERGNGITVRLFEALIREEQKRLAKLWFKERTVLGELGRISDAYRRRKIAAGESPKRGTKSGFLQSVLDTRTLWVVRMSRPTGKPGVAHISFRESDLIDIVPYYRWYRDGNDDHDGKTPRGAGALIMTKAFAKRLQKALREIEDDAAAGRSGRRRMKRALDHIRDQRDGSSSRRFRA
jgi:hypothetical protein